LQSLVPAKRSARNGKIAGALEKTTNGEACEPTIPRTRARNISRVEEIAAKAVVELLFTTGKRR
jgi:hypothetical protein